MRGASPEAQQVFAVDAPSLADKVLVSVVEPTYREADNLPLPPMLDMWTDVFASPGWRTTGTTAANFLVTPPGWADTVPAEFTQIKAPTPYVWIIGRTKTDGPPDYDAVHKIQAGYKITRLSQWGKQPSPPEVKIDSNVDMKTPPKTQGDPMSAVSSSPTRQSCSNSTRHTSPMSRSSRG
jgi:Protein of unknown function (DUF1254)